MQYLSYMCHHYTICIHQTPSDVLQFLLNIECISTLVRPQGTCVLCCKSNDCNCSEGSCTNSGVHNAVRACNCSMGYQELTHKLYTTTYGLALCIQHL